jgi:hypothetical protein
MQNEPNDNDPNLGYNKDNFDNIVEKIDLNNLKQINDTQHEHIFVRDSEETDTYYAMKCSHPFCHRGYLVSKI